MRRIAPAALIVTAILTLGVLPAWAASVTTDSSFSQDGVAKLDLRVEDWSMDVVVDGALAYLVGGSRRNSDAAWTPFVARYLENGHLDTSFGLGTEGAG